MNIPYLDSIYLIDQLQDYASPKSKLTTMIQSGEVMRVRRGLYLPGNSANRPSSQIFTGVAEASANNAPAISYSLKTLANKIYGPSYISFEYALSYYGFIPERVSTVTSAVFNKNKDKFFATPVGNFLYRYTNTTAYHVGVRWQHEGDFPFLIAAPEKAFCDALAKVRQISTIAELQDLLFNDWRVDASLLALLDVAALQDWVPLFRKSAITLFAEFLQEISHA